jgi:hypothetical protein
MGPEKETRKSWWRRRESYDIFLARWKVYEKTTDGTLDNPKMKKTNKKDRQTAKILLEEGVVLGLEGGQKPISVSRKPSANDNDLVISNEPVCPRPTR